MGTTNVLQGITSVYSEVYRQPVLPNIDATYYLAANNRN